MSFAIAGGILLALPFGGMLWTADSRCNRDQEAYGTQTGQPQGYQESEFAMRGGWLPCLAQQITAERQPSDATEHENRDLIAQETAAGVTFWIAVVAFLQLIATIWGLLYIRGTLRATLQAVEDTSRATDAMVKANEIAAHGQRAWLVIKDLIVTQATVMHPVGMPPQVAITYNFKVENVGKTPARKAEFRAFGAFAYGSEEKITAFLDESPEGHVAVAPQETRPSKAGLFTVANQPVREPEDAKVGDIVIAISLTYRSGDDGTPRQTARVFHIGKLDPSVGFIQPYRMDQLDTATVFFVQPVGPERIT